MKTTFYNIRVVNAQTEQEAIAKVGDGNFNEVHSLSDKVFTKHELINALEVKTIREVQPELINQFVSLSVAETLNHVNFNQKCMAKWGILSKELHWDIEGTKNTSANYLAPTHQQVVDWLRVEHGFRLVQMHDLDMEKFGYCLFSNEPIELARGKDFYKTYNKAIEKLLAKL